jgi:hypothetical protein
MRLNNNRARTIVAGFAVLALAAGCSRTEDEPSPDFLGEPVAATPTTPVGDPTTPLSTPGESEAVEFADEDYPFLSGGSISPGDLPSPLPDDSAMQEPVAIPNEVPTQGQLATLSAAWPTMSESEITTLLRREEEAQPTAAQRKAMAQLAEIRAPDSP